MDTISYLNIDNIMQTYKILITIALHWFFIECVYVAKCSFVLRELDGSGHL